MMLFNKKNGFGLIELMISILVASIIVAGLYKLLTASVLNFGISTATSRSGKSARQVDNFVNNLVFQAGYKNYIRVRNDYIFGPDETAFDSSNSYFNNTDDWSEGEFIRGGQEVASGDNTNSSVKFRYFGASINDDFSGSTDTNPNGYIFDCQGRSVPNTVLLEVMLFVKGNQGLACAQHPIINEDTTHDADYWDIDEEHAEIIDSSIVSMKILYGTTLFGDTSVFYPAAAVGKAWPYINLVKYSFVTSQPTLQKTTMSDANNVQLTLFADNDYSTTVPCPHASETESMTYPITSCGEQVSVSENFGKYKIPSSTTNNQRANMHKIIFGSVSLFNGYIYK